MTLPAVREVSPLNFELFEAELTLYPDRAKANFVLQGIKEGFRLGCDKPVTLKSARRNKLSAYQHSGVIDAYLANEVRLGRLAGPFDALPMQDLHVSSFGVIPKKGQPDKWRLIVDLSSPHGHSVSVALIWSLEMTWPGGKNFLVSGMEYPFSFFPPLSLCLTFLSVLMDLVLLVMVLLWIMNGSMVGGLLSNFHCPLLTRSFFRLF